MFDKKSLRKNLYQNSFWKTNLHPGNFYPKKIEGTSPKNLCTETFTEKKGHSPSIAKKNLHLKIQEKMFQKKPEQETVYQKNSEESLPKNIWRESLPKKYRKRHPHRENIVFEDNFLPKRRECPTKKIKYYLPKKFCRKILAFFSREISTKQNLKRYLYVKIREEKSLPKNVWRDISTKKPQETSPAKNLRREISSKESLKKKIHEISEKKSLPKPPSRDSSKISLKRNLYQTSIWEVFFTRNC